MKLARLSMLLGWLALLLSGCGGSEFPAAPVSGVVTLDGEPVANCRVAFEPIAASGETNAGPGSYAKTDADGRYRLALIDGSDGAVVGKHRITLSTEEFAPDAQEGDPPMVPEVIPAHFRDGRHPLEFEVPVEGTSTADFELSSTR